MTDANPRKSKKVPKIPRARLAIIQASLTVCMGVALATTATYLSSGENDTSFIPTLISFLISLTLGGVSAIVIRLTRRSDQPTAPVDPGERLRHRIKAVNNAFEQANTIFAEAGALTEELRRELIAQQAAHQQLVEEAERQRVLINMDREEAEAVQSLIFGNTQADKKRQRIREWAFFLSGLVLAVPINIVSNLIWPS
ncbi:hypothetical protein ABZ470_26445 [Streptosporangium sp. NPDC020072]|uniref:hypothetical protein n=1 Tax=Streptosporangium sp. NPDC020072 TaxID=3154788 RepID=UPI00341504D6